MSHKIRNLIFIILLLALAGLLAWYLLFNKKSIEGENIVDTQGVTGDMGDGEIDKIIEQPKVEIIYPENYENDKDSDGIDDVEEEKIGTSIWEPDTDGDGISDNVEIEKYGTDPTNPDTDGDGYWDGLEIVSGYNPVGEGEL